MNVENKEAKLPIQHPIRMGEARLQEFFFSSERWSALNECLINFLRNNLLPFSAWMEKPVGLIFKHLFAFGFNYLRIKVCCCQNSIN